MSCVCAEYEGCPLACAACTVCTPGIWHGPDEDCPCINLGAESVPHRECDWWYNGCCCEPVNERV